MATASPPGRLDPEQLDRIVAGLDLAEADALDRLQLWYKDLLRRAWDWFKAATGGEDGWLDRIGEWVEGVLSDLSDGERISADGVLTALYYGSVALVLFALLIIGWQLWQLVRPARAGTPDQFAYLPVAIEIDQPVTDLPLRLQVPALFSQVCRQLVTLERLELRPDATHASLANDARVNAAQRALLEQLAGAADRALFGGWQPGAEDLEALTERRNRLLAELTPVRS